MSKIKKKVFVSLDGNEAAAYCSYAFTEVASIYPITPSSPMAEHIDLWASQGKKNIFGNPVRVIEMQSEAGAAGCVHGTLQGGALASTYTASQGLLLMLPNIYKCVGELLPAVFHVSARAIASRSLSIFGDQQEVYAARPTGIPILCSHSVQEVADLAMAAHLCAIEASSPFLHFFDGFRTSHEIQKVELQSYEDMAAMLDHEALARFRSNALNPHTNPVTRGGNENDDIYFQGKEAQNTHYANVVGIVEKYLQRISSLTGRHYAPFTYYGAPDATNVIIVMGSISETAREVIDTLMAKGEKVGMVKVHLYRPFSAAHLLKVLPASTQKIAVLDRTKEIGAIGEPLYLDVYRVVKEARPEIAVIIGGRYGLSSKDTQPTQVKAVFDHLKTDHPFHGFTIGIIDDVTNLSLPEDPNFEVQTDYTSCLFYGLGSDGTVSANKNSIKIIGDHTDLYSQAYFAYDSKKAGGATRSNLRFGKSPIHSTYYVKNADFISCSLDSYLVKYDMLKNLKKKGTFLLNTTFSATELQERMPARVKKQLAVREAKFFIINATKIAEELGMGRRTNTILQSAFFKLNPTILPFEDAVKYMKKAVEKVYGKKGGEIVELNYQAIDQGASAIEEVVVDPSWKNISIKSRKEECEDEYFDYYAGSIASLDGNELPVSVFTQHGLLDGSMKPNATYKERRTIATEVPAWIKENCIQCGICAFVCPHSTIRAFLLTDEEVANAPEVVKSDVLDAIGGPNVKGLKYRIQVSTDNCVGCSLCAVECPGKGGKKALEMRDVKTQLHQVPGADYLYPSTIYNKGGLFPVNTVKGAAFLRPYFEVSGACAGCGETPYYRLATQLFGKDMLIANATGCTSIYCGSTPSTPFTTDENGEGPAWANSLFEDNAEYGFGMRMAVNYKLASVRSIIENNIDQVEPELKEVLTTYLAEQKNRETIRALKPRMKELIQASKHAPIQQLLSMERDWMDKSVWIVGGDGWAYDIGYGGLDHVLANRENVNILVLDTEVYSNTGGQSSKASQTGSIAKFSAAGKSTAKKDLAAIAMSYQHVYVAQIAMGANRMQVIKALREAESYDGPSLIVAYSPCIEHGIKGGLMNHQASEKKAVECGYWPIYRYDPRLEDQGKNPLQIDCAEPDFSKFRDFVLSEIRFNQLPIVNPQHADSLLEDSRKYAEARYRRLKRMVG